MSLPNTFPDGVDKTTALLDLLAGWMNHVFTCRDFKKKDLKRMGKTRAEWEEHHSQEYGDLTWGLYQAAGNIMLLPEEEQDKAVQKFVIEQLLPLFSSTPEVQ